MKIHKIQGDLTTEITSKIKDYCSIDCEMQGLKPDRDKLSIVSLTLTMKTFILSNLIKIIKLLI